MWIFRGEFILHEGWFLWQITRLWRMTVANTHFTSAIWVKNAKSVCESSNKYSHMYTRPCFTSLNPYLRNILPDSPLELSTDREYLTDNNRKPSGNTLLCSCLTQRPFKCIFKPHVSAEWREIFYFTLYINFSPCPALSGTATVSEQWFNKQIKVVA